MSVVSMILAVASESASNHQLETAETLIAAARFFVIFLAARALAESMVRFRLPTILGELVAGILIGLSGLHLILLPETQAEVSVRFLGVLGSLAHVGPDVVRDVYVETFPPSSPSARSACLPCSSSPDWNVSWMSWWRWVCRPVGWRSPARCSPWCWEPSACCGSSTCRRSPPSSPAPR